MNKFTSALLLITLLQFMPFQIFARGKGDIEIPSEQSEFSLSENEIENQSSESTLQSTLQENVPLTPKYKFREVQGEAVQLKECWGYVMQTHPEEYNSTLPLTDVCFFAAEVNCYGELVSVPKRTIIDIGKARSHLVVVCDSKSLSHFILEPKSETRKNLLKQIVKAAHSYDGVQIDFELVPVRDRKHFITFLADLRYMLGKEKWFSVCVPARFRLLSEDVYPYAEISRYCDRVFIMAYDEHWSTSKPGPIASVDWCRKVMEYATNSIPSRKLIMGMPFYGRTWASQTTASAWYFETINKRMTENNVEEIIYKDDIPTFTYTTQVDITGYMNDAYSVIQLCRLYENAGIKKMGFWRIGQEDPKVWNFIEINKNL